jgi:hypothetical protein
MQPTRSPTSSSLRRPEKSHAMAVALTIGNGYTIQTLLHPVTFVRDWTTGEVHTLIPDRQRQEI